jgi:hypothetical protein
MGKPRSTREASRHIDSELSLVATKDDRVLTVSPHHWAVLLDV